VTSRATPDRAKLDMDEWQAMWVVLAYLGPLAALPFFLKRRNAEVRWHAANGLLLLAAEIGLAAASIIIVAAASQLALALGCAFSLVFVVGAFAIAAIHLWAMLKALGGTRLYVLGLSEHAEQLCRLWPAGR
jgi:uncharacterized membrane protein